MKECLTNTTPVGTGSFTEGVLPLNSLSVQPYGLIRTSSVTLVSPCYHEILDQFPLGTTQDLLLPVSPKGFGPVDMGVPALLPPLHCNSP